MEAQNVDLDVSESSVIFVICYLLSWLLQLSELKQAI